MRVQERNTAVLALGSVRQAILNAIARQKQINPFISLTVRQTWQACRIEFPGLTRPDFRAALTRMHADGQVILGAWTLAPALMPEQDREHAFEHLHEVKYYVHSI